MNAEPKVSVLSNYKDGDYDWQEVTTFKMCEDGVKITVLFVAEKTSKRGGGVSGFWQTIAVKDGVVQMSQFSREPDVTSVRSSLLF